MPKKTTILIILLALVTAILVFFAISAETGRQVPPTENGETGDSQAPKTATVSFNPTTLTGTPGTVQSVDIMVDSGDSAISGVQAELAYDPATVTNVILEPDASTTGFFGSGANILFNDVNAETGRISYALTISPSQEAKQGNGKIGTLRFETIAGVAPVTTQVEFLNKTLVTVLGENESVLKETTPLSITIPVAINAPVVSPVVTFPPQDLPATTAPIQ